MPSRGKYLRRKYSSRSMRRRIRLHRLETLAYYAGACLLLAAAVFLLNGFLIDGTKRVNISTDNVAAFRIPHRAFAQLREQSAEYGIDFAQAVCLYSLENAFFPTKTEMPMGVGTFMRNYEDIHKSYREKDVEPYHRLLYTLLGEIKYFPIPLGYDADGDSHMFGDSWGTKSGGAHIIDRENVRGRIPVVSMTAGVVTEAGWKEKTGFQVIIRTSKDTYYSYSNLEIFTDGLEPGTPVQPGTKLGYMGVVGTSSVRLHLEISPQFSLVSKDFKINPYPFLRLVEEDRVEYVHAKSMKSYKMMTSIETKGKKV